MSDANTATGEVASTAETTTATDGQPRGKAETTDVLVIGSGIAGCASALAAARAGADVRLITKAERPEGASSWWAQGGIAVSRTQPEAFKRDVLAASDGTADPEAVDVLVGDANDAVRDVLLETLGVEFDQQGTEGSDGESDSGHDETFEYGREAAHGERRILHVDASTGRHVLAAFLSYLDDYEGIDVVEDTAALELITHEGRVHGVLAESEGVVEPIYAGSTVLGTGGIGALYANSTNPDGATGDGLGMAALAGAEITDMEYVQFHPTVADHENAFLVSEAVRGEGALLRNAEGERFMPEYHPDAELAPRDVVARAVKEEREATGEVRLDVSELSFAESFPDLAGLCEDRGIDFETGIPVTPAEHFLCGGISVDHEGRTSLDRLFAVGECSRTGVHGANRLASTSLLEGLVWGLRAGRAAAGNDPELVEAPELRDSDPSLPGGFADGKRARIAATMEEYVGIERTPGELHRAGAALRRLKGEVDAYVRTRTSRELYELRNSCVSALLIVRAASQNPNSKGCHHLVDASADDEPDEQGIDGRETDERSTLDRASHG